MLYSFGPAINYLTVHLLVTLFFQCFPDALYPPVLDTILCPMDALLRTNAVTSTLSLLYAPNVHHEYVSSPFTHMLLGAIVSAGGGFLVSTLGAWNADWAFSTPPVLRSGAGWLGTLDVWGGALVAFIYSATTGHPAFSSFSTYVSLVFSSSLLPHKPHPDSDFPPLSTLGGKSIATAALAILFAVRVIHTHWLTFSPPKAVGVPGSASKKPKKKTQ